ncbi:MAG: hypothetical protein GY717_02395 [Rhodobacteraceae bacterium]|nr:hypothetical protein [Paracoccaceae bacterium]
MTEILAKLLPLGLMLLMFVVGLRLSPASLVTVIRQPVALATGLAVQMVALPAVAFTLGWVFALPGPVLAGLVLVAAAPGGVTSNYIAYLARADLALSAAMTLVTTALASLTVPLLMSLTGEATLPEGGGLLGMSGVMAAVAVGPMVAGMAVLGWRPDIAVGILTLLDPGSKLIFIAMVLATFVQNRDAMTANLWTVGPAALALNLSALALAFTASTLIGLAATQRRAVMVEASLQNVAVALFVAAPLLGAPALSVPALVYAVVMNVSALLQIAAARGWSFRARTDESTPGPQT